MLRFTLAMLLLISGGPLHADLTVEQKIDGPAGSSTSTMKIKGDRARMDTDGPTGRITTLIDKSGKMVSYVHQSKLALVTSMTESQKAAREVLKKTGTEVSKPDLFNNTGQTERVGNWNCEVWIRHTPSVTLKEWRAKDIANLKRIQEQMAVLEAAPHIDLGRELQSDTYTVRTERNDAKGTTTMNVTRISEEVVSESDFTPPEGYREMKVPAQ